MKELKVGDKVKILSKSIGIPLISIELDITKTYKITEITHIWNGTEYRLGNSAYEEYYFYRKDLIKVGIDIL